MENRQLEHDLISHCIQFMSNKDDIRQLLISKGFRCPKSLTFKGLSERYLSDPGKISIQEITSLFRAKWTPCDVEMHMESLASLKLQGHSWHKARPSSLHLSFQDYVRMCCEGKISLDEYLGIGYDIVKHEYFMVAVHDLCETAIIQTNEGVIPPIRNKSMTDFVFRGIPYDLKITSHPESWKNKAGSLTKEEKMQLAYELYKGADAKRMRKNADECKHNWGLNRMYYIVSDQCKWEQNTTDTIQYLLNQLDNTDNFFKITVHDLEVSICLIEQ